jgi:carbon storage regulator
MLVLTRKDGEAVLIDGVIRVKVLGIQGGRVKLGFSAPPDIAVQREEILSRSASQPMPPTRACALSAY